MKSAKVLICTGLILALLPGICLADGPLMEELGSRAAKLAMDQLNFEKGDTNILALTTAGYAIAGGQTTERCVKGLTEVSGCSIGDGNLFTILRPHWKPLWFYFFDKNSGEAVYIQVDATAFDKSLEELTAASDDEIFSINSQANVDLDYMLNNTEEGDKTFNEKLFAGNEFSVVGFSNVWASPNSSFDFLQATAFHDHLCPGVTSGYMLAKFMENALPINDISAESYKVIACPNWCKDDALQVLWDATPGKSSMFVMALTDTEKSALNAKYNQSDVAGIYVRWNDTAKKGDAMVLTFNWTKSGELTGTNNWEGPSWGSKLVSDVRLMDYWNTPELFVSVIKEFDVDSAKLAQLQNAGMHPLKVAGVL